jgi:hypothetical protein
MKTKILIALCALFLVSCSGEENDNTNNNNGGVSNTLHLSFKTPDWEEFINCEQLDLYGYPVNETTNYVSATSASTKESFYFAIPVTKLAMDDPANLKKYAIREYGNVTAPFEFSQKLPVTKGADSYLISEEGLDDQSYNEVVAITFEGNDGNEAIYKVKCRYQMRAHELNNESNVKTISGTFHFKVRTSID